MDVGRRARRVVTRVVSRENAPQPPAAPQPAAAGPGSHATRIRNQARRLDELERRAARDGRRITELESELQEARHLNKRIAELADVVAEVLLPADQRDDARISARLTEYHRALRGRTDPS